MALCSTTPDDQPKGSAQNPFVLKKGITFTIISRVKKPDGSPFDISTYTPRAELRKQRTDVGTPVATFTVTLHPTETGRADAEIGAAASEANANLVNGDTYIFDIEYEHPTDPQQVVPGGEGYVLVVDGVTKS